MIFTGFSGITGSIRLLLMPWLLALPSISTNCNAFMQGLIFFFFFFFFFLICKMIIIFLCVFVLTAWCAFTYVLLLYVLYVVTECNRKIDIWNLDSRINSRMEPEVYNNMMKCIINALSPKRVSDPAYGKDWLIDWLIDSPVSTGRISIARAMFINDKNVNTILPFLQ